MRYLGAVASHKQTTMSAADIYILAVFLSVAGAVLWGWRREADERAPERAPRREEERFPVGELTPRKLRWAKHLLLDPLHLTLVAAKRLSNTMCWATRVVAAEKQRKQDAFNFNHRVPMHCPHNGRHQRQVN